MPYRFSTVRLLGLLLVTQALEARAQIDATGSPYSAFGFGDLLPTGQIPAALMGGTGIAYTEQFGICSANLLILADSEVDIPTGRQLPRCYRDKRHNRMQRI